MLTKEQAKKIISVGVHNQLTKQLYTLEHVTSQKDAERIKDKLRDMMAKLFSFKEVMELHNDQIIEIAETIAGLYPEREDLNGYVYYILVYLEKQISKYNKARERYIKELHETMKREHTDPDKFLDLQYKTWTYTEGYYYQRSHMYHLLRQSLKDLLLFEERGVICRKKHTS